MDEIILYGAAGSGSVPVEAALELLGVRYRVIETVTWADPEARARVGEVNALGQVPTLLLPDGELLTESAAILIWLADRHPQARLAPLSEAPLRAPFLRWMLFVSSAIYALHWIKPDVRRVGATPSQRERVHAAVHARIADCWAAMDAQIHPGRWLLGDDLTVLDLYVAAISRFGPWRPRFNEVAPKMAEVMRRVDEEPRLAAFWRRRFPED